MGINTKDNSKDSIAIANEVNQMNDPSNCTNCYETCSDGHHVHRQTQLPEATPSSSDLLEDCGNTSTHAVVAAEQHVHAHHCRNQLPPATPESLNHNSSDTVPDSIFLTPSGPRQGVAHGRPFSAPANYLEMISGQLLRLVGDHYMCSNCGRQLRNMGDQLTLENNLRHAFSSVELTNIRARDS